MPRGTGWRAVSLVAALWAAAPIGIYPTDLAAQGLTLVDALARADEAAYPNRMASGDQRAHSGAALGALQGVLPTLRVDGGYLRTTDPLNSFGILLRQRAVTLAAFDPDALNHPDAMHNYAVGLVVEQPIFNPDAWMGRAAAVQASKAAGARTSWTREQIRFAVIRAWFGVAVAEQRVATLEAALAAARQHVRQAESMVAAGLVTRSDALLASVKAGEVESDLIAARGAIESARRGLALLIGSTEADLPPVSGDLPSPGAIRMVLEGGPAGESEGRERPDVQAAEWQADAARLDQRRAEATLLPRLNGFARVDWHDRTTPFGGDRSWTVGVMASWSLFGGGKELGDMRSTAGRQEAARAMAEGTRAQAEVEVRDAATARSVARSRLAIAEAAVIQSEEAHRIVARKYEGEIATVLELLDASAVETRSRLGLAAALFDAITSEARWRLVRGDDLSALARLLGESS